MSSTPSAGRLPDRRPGPATRWQEAGRLRFCSYRLSDRYRLFSADDNLGHSARLDRDRGAVGHCAQRRLHAMQTLSQPSYSPTVSCSHQSRLSEGESSTAKTVGLTTAIVATALGETTTAAKSRRGEADQHRPGPSWSGHARRSRVATNRAQVDGRSSPAAKTALFRSADQLGPDPALAGSHETDVHITQRRNDDRDDAADMSARGASGRGARARRRRRLDPNRQDRRAV